MHLHNATMVMVGMCASTMQHGSGWDVCLLCVTTPMVGVGICASTMQQQLDHSPQLKHLHNVTTCDN